MMKSLSLAKMKKRKIEDSGINIWKDFYYKFRDLIREDIIFSKLHNKMVSRLYYTGEYASLYDHILSFFKNLFVIPALLFWKIFLIKFECLHYKRKYPEICTLENIKDENFDYLFVLNTRDHTITALPVLESMDNKAKSLVVTFKGVYTKYKNDFGKLKNTKVVFFEYELKNLPLAKYIEIIKKSKNKIRLLESQNLDSDLKQLIEIDKIFIKFHLKTELIQYYFFEKIFNAFDLKGAVSIVFTTAFELCKERGIPTFVLQHGIGGKGHGHPYVSDYWFTFDDISKESLDDWLDHTVNVLPLGAPRFEYLAGVAKKRKREEFNRKIGKPVNTKNVTYISVGTEGFENKELFLALKKLREQLPDDVNLIIKLHPREGYNTKKVIKKTFSKEELKRIVFTKKEIDFYEILANSDIVITTVSTGMQESIAMDIPTLQVNFTRQLYPLNLNLSSFGWREPIDNPEVLIREVLLTLNDGRQYKELIEKQRWLKNRLFKNFGSCGKVIAETIINICEKKSSK